MKRFLLICLILFTAGSLVAQTPTVASLTTTSGTAIQWYSLATGGTLYNGTEALVNGQHYYASQTVNGVESATRLDVIATVTVIPSAPTAASHVVTQTQIDWKWAAVTGASGYKWSATNNYNTATDLGNVLIKTESSLTCGTSYTRYVWAYNTTACGSTTATFTQSTTSCVSAPTLTTSAVSNIGSTTSTFNGNITAINGAAVTTRGFKYSTTDGFNPASTGTTISETGTYGTGNFNLSPSGLTTITTYYVVAYATNSAGTTYGSQVSFNTLIQTDYAYNDGQQTFVVPAGVTSITIQAWGAQGGLSGAYGGYATGILSVSQGQTLYLYVGGQGGTVTGGFNGGGSGGCETVCGSGSSGGGGGGASDVRTVSNGLGNRVLVAAGGGGYAGNGAGAGGGSTGADAPDYNTGYGGHGGTQVGGGTAGSYLRNATDGGLGYGGNGSSGYSAWGGGGGGGGYYGGGGGTSTVDHSSGYSDGGGGGSSYTGGVTSGGSTTADQKTGNGRILITY